MVSQIFGIKAGREKFDYINGGRKAWLAKPRTILRATSSLSEPSALGIAVKIFLCDGGNTRVKVPEGSQSGRRFRIQGKGMPVLRSKQAGDMYIQVLVETPQKLTKRQRELLSEFERLSSRDTQPESSGFFGKVKEFLGRSGQA